MKTLMILLLSTLPASAIGLGEKEILEVLNQSATLQGVQAGVKRDYGMTECTKFELTEAVSDNSPIKARSICTYKDQWGDEAGVLIDVEGDFYSGTGLLLTKIDFIFAG